MIWWIYTKGVGGIDGKTDPVGVEGHGSDGPNALTHEALVILDCAQCVSGLVEDGDQLVSRAAV